MTQTLEDTLRDIVARGELSHLSLAPSQGGKMWRASFAMCSHFGVSFAEDKDPVQAIIVALTSAKLKKPRTTINLKPGAEPEPDAIDATGQPLKEDPLADLM
jgi:hypothetical protein